MLEPRDIRSVVESAEQAAAAGDHASAERLLREAASLQEAQLGPLHPDLANTLNNLGVLYEITDKPTEAEDCYRRAYAIATAVLPSDHPFVATSGKNLRDFRQARGRPYEVGGAQPSPDVEPPPAAPPLALPKAAVDVPRERPPQEPPRPSTRLSRPLVIGAICACILVVAALIAARLWFGSNAEAGFTPADAAPPLRASPAPTPEPVPAAPLPAPNPAATVTNPPAAAPESPRGAASAPGLPSVAEARVCRKLATEGSRDWQCDPTESPGKPGTFFFYTRVKAARDTTVQHRWYQGARLRQAVELPVRANPGGGYRTYSRNTVSRPNAGDWKVELRAKDGTLLAEERFTVR